MMVLAGLLLCAARVAQWTVLEGEDLAQRARRNFLTQISLQAPRGNIYDAHGCPLAVNVQTYTLSLARYRSRPDDLRRIVADLERYLGRSFDGLAEQVIESTSRWKQYPVCRGLSLTEITPILERRPELPGLWISEERRRHYSLGEAAAFVVGYTTFPWREEVEEGRISRTRRDQLIGRMGLEAYYDEALQGARGLEVAESDARGRIRRSAIEQPGRPGYDLFTTLDSDLQQAAYDLLDGRVGTLMAMNPQTGEILALASRPGFDPRHPGRRTADGQEPSFLHRACSQHYPPGSPFKIATALAGLCAGHALAERHECRGRIELPSWPGRFFHCDNRAGHGTLGMAAALKYSCNVYFYELARSLGPRTLLETASRLGLDRKSGIDLPNEVAGSLGRIDPEKLDAAQEIMLGIGQGPLAVTPLQILRATAAVATRGRLVVPHLGKSLLTPENRVLELGPWPIETISAPPEAWEGICSGLYRAVNEQGGTAFAAAMPRSWQVCGKTGTAERPPGEADAWFVGFAPRNKPELVVLAMLERSGHGGAAAAPLARDLFAAYFDRAERTPPPVVEVAAAPSAPAPALPIPEVSPPPTPPPTPTPPPAATPEPATVPTTPTLGGYPHMISSTSRPASDYTWDHDAIIRGPRDRKQMALIFTGGEYGEGGLEILDTLQSRGIKGSFFFTGDFLRKPEYDPIIRRILTEGHYLGPHGDAHLLYCPWDDRNKTLVTREEFTRDLQKNMDDLVARGADRETMRWWIPPYEWYNTEITQWSLDAGIRLFNFSPGTSSNADYTEETDKRYIASSVIYYKILEYESSKLDGLNGFLLLTHVGAGAGRPDKFFRRLPVLVDELKRRGYEFVRVDELLAAAPLKP
jgi:penicillin-binding protein 2